MHAAESVKPRCLRSKSSPSYLLSLSLPRQALCPGPYGEPLSEARTPLADFFRIL
ncbi:MAG: hypothetical protein OJF47_001332 [Nitrospira sp.]|nr:MAG: hypothetical protein OJF47_001332 [Nitrospira sp.]